MIALYWVLLGGVGGVALGLLLSRPIIRRQVARVRAAERRARGAERLAEIGAMTGGLAHEIKNPLSTIGLNAQLLEEGLGDLPSVDDAERSRLLRRVGALRREVERLRGILQDFLQFAGQVRLDARPGDLNQVVAELADFFLPQATTHGVRLRTDLAPGELRAPLDAPHLKQAVLNLMLNAVQAMGAQPEGAPRELILKTERREGAPRARRRFGGDAGGEDAPALDGGPRLLLHVIDTGPGIPPERLGRIFEPYFTTKSGGTGLGLPTTRRLVEAHGGRIDVHSEPGRGTDFTIVLPAGGVSEVEAAAVGA